jgi:hypothetical protein
MNETKESGLDVSQATIGKRLKQQAVSAFVASLTAYIVSFLVQFVPSRK